MSLSAPTFSAELQALYRALRERRLLRVNLYDALLLAPEDCRPVIEHPAFDLIHTFVLGVYSKTRAGRFLRSLNLRYPDYRITLSHLNRYRRWVFSQERDPRGDLLLKGQGRGHRHGKINCWRDTQQIARTHLLVLPPPRPAVKLERLLELISTAPEPYRERLSELWRYPRRYPRRLEDVPGVVGALKWLDETLDKTCSSHIS